MSIKSRISKLETLGASVEVPSVIVLTEAKRDDKIRGWCVNGTNHFILPDESYDAFAERVESELDSKPVLVEALYDDERK